MVHREKAAAIATPVIPRRGEPGLPDRIGVREDAVVRQLRSLGNLRLAGAPARGDDVPRVVRDDAVVHHGEIAEGRRSGHVVSDDRSGRRAVGVLDVERDLDRLLVVELTSEGIAGSGADLAAAGRELREAPLVVEGGVVRILPGVGPGDDQRLSRAVEIR